MPRKEQIKEAAKKRQEKLEDMEAKTASRPRSPPTRPSGNARPRKRRPPEGRPVPQQAPVAAAAPSAPKPSNHSEARLRLQTASGNVIKTYPADTTLFEVAQQLEAENGTSVTSFSTTFPAKDIRG